MKVCALVSTSVVGVVTTLSHVVVVVTTPTTLSVVQVVNPDLLALLLFFFPSFLPSTQHFCPFMKREGTVKKKIQRRALRIDRDLRVTIENPTKLGKQTSPKKHFSPEISLRFLCAHANSCDCMPVCSHMSACGIHQ